MEGLKALMHADVHGISFFFFCLLRMRKEDGGVRACVLGGSVKVEVEPERSVSKSALFG